MRVCFLFVFCSILSFQAARASLDRSAVLFAIKTIQSADVNLLVLDATRGVTAHEKRIAGYILDAKSSVIVVVNKSDLLINQSEKVKEEYETEVRKHLKFMPWVPVVFVSALEGVNVSSVIDLAISVNLERKTRVPTRKLWDLLQRALMRRSAPSKGKEIALFCAALILPPVRAFETSHRFCRASENDNANLCVLCQ